VTPIWVVVIVVAGVCASMRVAVPLLMGRRAPTRLTRALGFAVPALLAALVVTQFADGTRFVLDARLAGVAAAAVVAIAGRPLLLAVATAVATTALIRALT